jgi:thymidylate synthase (FAD)
MDNNNLENKTKLYDCLEGKETIIEGLLDGKGFVKIVDVGPRLVPEGYTSEYMAVLGARCSFGMNLKTPEADKALISYLVKNHHTSPLELCNITFMIKCPKFVNVHILRHRTGKFNEFSQRYAEVPEEDNFYNPLEYENGIRKGAKLNKQSSENIEDDSMKLEITKTMEEANDHIYKLHDLYHKMIKQGLAKEIARSYLPMSEYTTMYVQFDLNNLSKFLYLRNSGFTQHETQLYANAMETLARQFFPITLDILQERRTGFSLLDSEISVLKGEKPIESITSVSEKKALREKAETLGIKL